MWKRKKDVCFKKCLGYFTFMVVFGKYNAFYNIIFQILNLYFRTRPIIQRKINWYPPFEYPNILYTYDDIIRIITPPKTPKIKRKKKTKYDDDVDDGLPVQRILPDRFRIRIRFLPDKNPPEISNQHKSQKPSILSTSIRSNWNEVSSRFRSSLLSTDSVPTSVRSNWNEPYTYTSIRSRTSMATSVYANPDDISHRLSGSLSK